MTPTHLKAGTALVLALAAGFGLARLTTSETPSPAPVETPAPAAPTDSIAITPAGIAASEIVVAPAGSGTVDMVLSATATVEAAPDAEAVLTARAAGTVTRLFKRIGDPVRAGETVALVESRDASAIVADRAAAAARVTLANRQLARERTLLAQGVSPRADYETAEAGLAVARADAGRAAAAAGAARIAADGRSVAVVSPIAGRITTHSSSLGAYVAADTELFRVADPRRLQIEASLPPADAAHVRPGDRVILSTDDGQTIEAKVRTATGVVDPVSRAATLIVTPTAGGSILTPGQFIRARIFASGDPGTATGVTVPQEAVQTLGDRSVVFVRTAQGFRAATVRTGTRSAGLIQILSGLPAGTPVATGNAFLLKAELLKGEGEE